MSVLKCGQCGHENDLTRVFCQNCGARLERTEGTEATIAAPTQVPTERPAITRKRKAEQAKRAGRVVGFFVSIVITVLMAAGFAELIQMAREPEGIPLAKKASADQASQLYQSLKTFSDSTFPRAIDVKQDQINNYLACRLVSGASEGDTASQAKAKFVRAFVVIGKDTLRYCVEEQFLGQSLFIYADYQPEMVDKVVTLKEVGGGIGHVKFNEYLLPLLDRLIGPVAKSAVDVTDVVQNLNGLDLKIDPIKKEGVATLRWTGKPTGQ